jgi:hypothetical protein
LIIFDVAWSNIKWDLHVRFSIWDDDQWDFWCQFRCHVFDRVDNINVIVVVCQKHDVVLSFANVQRQQVIRIIDELLLDRWFELFWMLTRHDEIKLIEIISSISIQTNSKIERDERTYSIEVICRFERRLRLKKNWIKRQIKIMWNEKRMCVDWNTYIVNIFIKKNSSLDHEIENEARIYDTSWTDVKKVYRWLMQMNRWLMQMNSWNEKIEIEIERKSNRKTNYNIVKRKNNVR